MFACNQLRHLESKEGMLHVSCQTVSKTQTQTKQPVSFRSPISMLHCRLFSFCRREDVCSRQQTALRRSFSSVTVISGHRYTDALGERYLFLHRRAIAAKPEPAPSHDATVGQDSCESNIAAGHFEADVDYQNCHHQKMHCPTRQQIHSAAGQQRLYMYCRLLLRFEAGAAHMNCSLRLSVCPR